MPTLRRTHDGAGDTGARVEAIKWHENGRREIIGHRPIIGCSLLVGSLIARSYSSQDWWLTTVIEEILEEDEREDGLYVKFKTTNSIYEYFSGNAPWENI